ncbi:MFS transporter [Actinomycetospora chlora]|uniref:MFS transporter n=1 Tax=Actinomycetospora chlora TaxID=663608 RepID=A0ABP9C0X8_9PSEU
MDRPAPPATGTAGPAPASSWAPLAHPAFRWIWLASLVSNVGTWMQTVGAQWLLVDGHASSAVIALVQTASSLPVLLVTLPAGVIAEFVDRRRVLLAAQVFQLVVGVLLAVLTLVGATEPALLLTFTFLLGCGAAAQMPAYQAFVPDLVPRDEIGSAAALGSIAVNLARAAGPAIAGLLIPSLGVAGVFGVNALTFAVFAVALLRAPSPPRAPGARQSFLAGLESGGRYVRHAPAVRRMMLRLVLFAFPAGVLWALLAPVAHDRLGLGSSGYGLLLGAAGVGSVAGALVLPRLRARVSFTVLVAVAGLVSGAAMVVVGVSRSPAVVVPVLLLAGAAWITVIAGTNALMQTFLPRWVRARALSIYQLVVFTTSAVGSAVWGLVADAIGTGTTFVVAGVCLVGGAATVVRWPLLRTDVGTRDGVDPAAWTAPEVTLTPDVADDPVRVSVVYRVAPEQHAAFLAAAPRLRDSRRRTGGSGWDLARDGSDSDVFVEEYTVPSWDEYTDQNTERLTAFDRGVLDVVRALAAHVGPPTARFLVAR